MAAGAEELSMVARTASGAGCPCKQSIRKGAAGGDQEGGS